MLLAFATTLVSGLKMVDEVFFNLKHDDEEDLLFWLTRAILKRPGLFPTQRSPSASVTDSFTDAMKASISKRRMFLLFEPEQNDCPLGIGLGPVSMAAGDDIFVLPGGKMPFVLRFVRSHNRPGQDFNLIGDCYCHGAMNGEYGLPIVPRGLPFGLIEAACWEMMRLCDAMDMWHRLLRVFQKTGTLRHTWEISKTINRAMTGFGSRQQPPDEQDVVSWNMVNKFSEHVHTWAGKDTREFPSLFLV